MTGPVTGPGLRVQVLGALRVWRGGELVALGGVRRKALLGLLALQSGVVVTVPAITRALWDGEPPPTAGAMIQSYVSRLRAVLAPGNPRGGPVETVDGGYRLRADGAGIDLRDCQRLAGLARETLSAGDAARGCELFGRAVGLWRGELLADVPLLRGHPVVVRAEHEHAAMVVEYAEAASAQGWHERVLGPLEVLAQRAALDERVHACLMIALAGTGQQAAALEAYHGIRRRLDDELGVRPGRALADALARVLRGEVPQAALKAQGGGPASIAPAHSDDDGLAVLAHDQAGPSVAGASAVLPTRVTPCQLPPAVVDFTGRQSEVTRLREWVGGGSGVPVVVVSGPPGVGKSALALYAAHGLRGLFPDGQLWAGLDGGSGRERDPGEVLGEWLHALGVHGSAIPSGVAERAALFRSRVADRRVLVVADDAGSAGQVGPLLPGTGGCAVIVTSRRQLPDLAGARLLQVGPLSEADAMELLLRIAGTERVTAEPEAAGELVAACGWLPLAVRIAGAKLVARPGSPIAGLVGAMGVERRRLDVLRVGDLSVRASVASGFAALSEVARRAFVLLGGLGPCEVAEWVVAALLGVGDAGVVVEELADRSMVGVVGTDGMRQARYRLHDLLCEFAAEQASGLPAAERAAALQRAHHGWLQLASLASAGLPAEPFFPRHDPAVVPQIIPEAFAHELTRDPLAWFHAERSNLLEVTEYACRNGCHAWAAGLAICQAQFQHLRDRHQDAMRIWQAILSAAEQAGDTSGAAAARLRVAAAMVEQGHSARATSLLDDCVFEFERSQDLQSLAFSLYWRGCCAWDLNLLKKAQQDTELGVTLARSVGDRHAELMNLRALGNALGRLGDHARSIQACEEALRLCDQEGGESFTQYALHNLAYCSHLAGQHDRAIELAMLRWRLCEEVGDLRGQALCLAVLGDAYSALGRNEEAAEAYREALPVFRRLLIQRHQALCLYRLGRAYQAMGDHRRAVLHLQESLLIFDDLRLPAYQELAAQALHACKPSFTAGGGPR